MAQNGQGGSFWGSLPGLLTAMASLLTAVAGIYVLVRGAGDNRDRSSVMTLAGSVPTSPGCRSGYVWRQARPGDRVCVLPVRRDAIVEENAQALERRKPGGGEYGEDTCRPGYVWRNVSEEDHVCVTPESRGRAWRENELAPERAAS